jgi:hypothetical protein
MTMLTAAMTDLRHYFSPSPHPHLFPRHKAASYASLMRCGDRRRTVEQHLSDHRRNLYGGSMCHLQ